MFLGETQHLSGNNRALWWSILVDNQAHNEQKPIFQTCIWTDLRLFIKDFVSFLGSLTKAINMVL